jgi:transcriptional regulator with XRE-family HTH domain
MPPRAIKLAGRTRVGDLLRTARTAAGLTPAELSVRSDIPAESIVRWERGYVLPSAGGLARLALALPEVTHDLLVVMAEDAA